MAIIVCANPKGGSSKSTTSLVLGLTLASRGASVCLIDADANHPLTTWHGDGPRPVTVIGGLTDETFLSRLDHAAGQYDAVIVDLEGTASRIMSRAIIRADLVLVPMQASAIDAAQAGRAVGLIRQEEELLRRRIPFRVLLTRTNPAIASRAQRQILDEMLDKDIPSLTTHLHERSAYKALWAYRSSLTELDEGKVNGVAQAIANAETLTDEVCVALRDILAGRAAA